ncbi:MAG: endolytic transglycosylase MltG [Bacteroides sp.]|nr:endolytic transglycosylase MltG [Bacteroides sp.]MCM1413087.1 endolytic transglycosylase MltG [Bacteroides sp.]MCM1472171.1 endolytic transglycosylase MltG [Bacteroides sp.]
MSAKSSEKEPKSQSAKKKSRFILWILIAVFAVGLCLGAFCVLPRNSGDSKWIYVEAGDSRNDIKNKLTSTLGVSDGARVYALWLLVGGDAARSHGAYKLSHGDSYFNFARRMAKGIQSPVRVTWTNSRTIKDFADAISGKLECTSDDLLKEIGSLSADSGVSMATFPAMVFPDTYEVYWTSSPRELLQKLMKYGREFWTDSRRSKAEKLGLTPVQVVTIASIVEEESSKTDEYGKIGRLYINRLKSGMKLQADPTVKYALGDFSLRRIRQGHTSVDSPYNTYKYVGLPPGPIRFVDKRTIDAVLDAPEHSYIYMCAKEDFSGRHNFAVDYTTHLENARKYQRALDSRNIN